MDGGGKKRGSERQITKDDREEDQDGGEVLPGTFQKAEDAVIAGRRIVKARRPPPSGVAGAAAVKPSAAPPPKAGLFSGFSLIHPSAPQAPRSPAPAAVGDSDGTGVGGDDLGGREEADLDPRGRPVPPVPDPEEEEGPPKAAEADVTETPESDDDEISSAPKKPAGDEGKEGKPSEEKTEPSGDGNEVAGGGDAAQPGKGDAKDVLAASSKPKGTDGFAKLSSATNAFASPFGGAFPGSSSSSPFSFGVPASAGANLTTPSVSPLLGASAGATSTFPSLSSVFGTSNGTRVQLFGSGSAGSPDGGSGGLPSGLSAGATPAPAVSLPAVDVVTGEEEERSLFAGDATLFEFVEEAKWKERGKGEVRLNAPDRDSRPARLVMRAKGNLRLLLNANLFPELKVTKMDGRGLSFACVNSIEESTETGAAAAVALRTMALRFKDPALAADLIELIDANKQHKGSEQVKEEKGEDASHNNDRRKDQADVEAGKSADADQEGQEENAVSAEPPAGNGK